MDRRNRDQANFFNRIKNVDVLRSPYPQHLASANRTSGGVASSMRPIRPTTTAAPTWHSPPPRHPYVHGGGTSISPLSNNSRIVANSPKGNTHYSPPAYPSSVQPMQARTFSGSGNQRLVPGSTHPSHIGISQQQQQQQRIVLVGWYITIDPLRRVVIVSGNFTKPNGVIVNRHSSPIEKAVDSHTLVSNTGSIYQLVDPVNVEMMRMKGFPEHLLPLFLDGFPRKWKIMVEKYYNSVASLGRSPPTTSFGAKRNSDGVVQPRTAPLRHTGLSEDMRLSDNMPSSSDTVISSSALSQSFKDLACGSNPASPATVGVGHQQRRTSSVYRDGAALFAKRQFKSPTKNKVDVENDDNEPPSLFNDVGRNERNTSPELHNSPSPTYSRRSMHAQNSAMEDGLSVGNDFGDDGIGDEEQDEDVDSFSSADTVSVADVIPTSNERKLEPSLDGKEKRTALDDTSAKPRLVNREMPSPLSSPHLPLSDFLLDDQTPTRRSLSKHSGPSITSSSRISQARKRIIESSDEGEPAIAELRRSPILREPEPALDKSESSGIQSPRISETESEPEEPRSESPVAANVEDELDGEQEEDPGSNPELGSEVSASEPDESEQEELELIAPATASAVGETEPEPEPEQEDAGPATPVRANNIEAPELESDRSPTAVLKPNVVDEPEADERPTSPLRSDVVDEVVPKTPTTKSRILSNTGFKTPEKQIQRTPPTTITRSGRKIQQPREWWTDAQNRLSGNDSSHKKPSIRYRWGTGDAMVVKDGKRVKLSDYYLENDGNDECLFGDSSDEHEESE